MATIPIKTSSNLLASSKVPKLPSAPQLKTKKKQDLENARAEAKQKRAEAKQTALDRKANLNSDSETVKQIRRYESCGYR